MFLIPVYTYLGVLVMSFIHVGFDLWTMSITTLVVILFSAPMPKTGGLVV